VVLSNPTLGTEVTLINTDDGVFADAAVVPSSGYALKVTRKGFTSCAFTQRIKGTVGFEAFNPLNRQQATAVNAITYFSVAPLPPGLIKALSSAP
jgi:hypothetical protein